MAEQGAAQGGVSNANETPAITPGTTPGETPPKGKVETPKEEPRKSKEKDGGKEDPKEKKAFTPNDDDDEIPEDAELIQLSQRALKARLQRHTQRELKERFGHTDIEKIEKELKELSALRAEKEEARKAQLTKEQRLAEEKKQAEDRAKAAEEKAQKLEDERDVNTVSDRFSKIGQKHMAPKFFEKKTLRDGIFGELATYLHDKTGGQAVRITDKLVDDFFRDYVKENPEFGLKAEPVVEVPVNAGGRAPASPPGQANPAGAGAQTKTARPGQPNSMTREEIAKQFGNRW